MTGLVVLKSSVYRHTNAHTYEHANTQARTNIM